jgi:hypothetical protein
MVNKINRDKIPLTEKQELLMKTYYELSKVISKGSSIKLAHKCS